jgi:hypothetical protein
MRIIARSLTVGLLVAGLSVPLRAQPGPMGGPCAEIRAACSQAGFVPNGAEMGLGIVVDCIRPIMAGTPQRPRAARRLPRISSKLVAACRSNNPTFGQGRGGPPSYGGPPPGGPPTYGGPPPGGPPSYGGPPPGGPPNYGGPPPGGPPNYGGPPPGGPPSYGRPPTGGPPSYGGPPPGGPPDYGEPPPGASPNGGAAPPSQGPPQASAPQYRGRPAEPSEPSSPAAGQSPEVLPNLSSLD